MGGSTLRLLCVGLLVYISGCANTVGSRQGLPDSHWQGRMAVKVTAPQPQSFSAKFELDGDANAGTLRLGSPLGITIAVIRWMPGSATLTANAEPRSFDSLSALTQAGLGVDVPIANLFDWLRGQPSRSDTWEADLTQIGDGKLTVVRTAPDVQAELRLLLETP